MGKATSDRRTDDGGGEREQLGGVANVSGTPSIAVESQAPGTAASQQPDAQQQKAERGGERHPARRKGRLLRSKDVADEDLIDSEIQPREVLGERQGTHQRHQRPECEPHRNPLAPPKPAPGKHEAEGGVELHRREARQHPLERVDAQQPTRNCQQPDSGGEQSAAIRHPGEAGLCR